MFLSTIPNGLGCCHGLAENTEEISEDLPAVAKAVDEKVDAAVDAEQDVTNQENLGTHRNMLQSSQY